LKMGKKWKVALALTLLTVAYVCFVVWTKLAYDKLVSDTVQRIAAVHPELVPYIDVFYTDTVYGRAAIVMGAVVAIVDVAFVLLMLCSKAKSSAVVF
jgi:hypothetical protein